MSGFIKLRRGLKDHWIAQDYCALAVFTHLLLEANWADNRAAVDGGVVDIKRGEVRTSARQIADKLGMNRNTVSRRLSVLIAEGVLSHKKSGRFSIYSITKYDNGEEVEPEKSHKRDINDDIKRPPHKKNKEEERRRRNINTPRKKVFGHFGHVHLTEAQETKYRDEYGEVFFNRLVEKLDSWIAQDPTPKRIKNGKNADATFRAWVLNAVLKEQVQAEKSQAYPKRRLSQQEELVSNLKQKIFERRSNESGFEGPSGGSFSVPGKLL